MSAKNKEVAIYPRVSTLVQEDGTSLETQEAECTTLALSLGYLVNAKCVHREVWSGSSVKRPQLEKLRRMAAAGELEALFVYTADRLARDPYDLLTLMREFDKCGVAVHFVRDSSDPSPEGELVRFVLGFSGHRERAMIRLRTMNGRIAVAKAGRMPVGARDVTYGYDDNPVTKGRLANEEEAKVVQWIYRKYAGGWSMNRIGLKLNKEGITSKKGRAWSVTVLKSLLTSTSYIELDYYGKTHLVGGKRVARPREEWIEIKGYSPRLVSDKLFQKVQERLAGVQARLNAFNKRQYMMTSYARCGKCGGPVSGAGGSRGNWYYRCSGAWAMKFGVDPKCDAKRVPGRWMEEQVWTSLVEMVLDPSGVISDLELNVQTGGGDLGAEIERLQSEVARAEQEEVRLLGLYLRGTIREELLDTQMVKLSDSLEDLRSRLAALEEQREREESVAEAGDRIREYCLRVSAELENLDVDGKRALMSRLGVDVLAVKRDLMITAELDPGFVVNEVTS